MLKLSDITGSEREKVGFQGEVSEDVDWDLIHKEDLSIIIVNERNHKPWFSFLVTGSPRPYLYLKFNKKPCSSHYSKFYTTYCLLNLP